MDEVKNIDVIAIKPIYDKDDFKRRELFYMAKNIDIPQDVLDSDFSEVLCEYKKFYLLAYEISVNYKASVGYRQNRQVPYRNKFYENGEWKYGIQYKTERYIDYRAFANSETHKTYVAVSVDDSSFSEVSVFELAAMKAITHACEDEERYTYISGKQEVAPSRKILLKGESYCKQVAESKCKNTLPGDEHKDFTATSDGKLIAVKCFEVPIYCMRYNYLGRGYEIVCSAVKWEHSGNESYPILPIRVTEPQFDWETYKSEQKIEIKRRSLVVSAVIICLFALFYWIVIYDSGIKLSEKVIAFAVCMVVIISIIIFSLRRNLSGKGIAEELEKRIEKKKKELDEEFQSNRQNLYSIAYETRKKEKAEKLEKLFVKLKYSLISDSEERKLSN